MSTKHMPIQPPTERLRHSHQLTSIRLAIPLYPQKQIIRMHRSYSEQIIRLWFYHPKLVRRTWWIPLNNTSSSFLRLVVNVDIESTLKTAYLIGIASLNELPSLVEPPIAFPLDNLHSSLHARLRDIQHLPAERILDYDCILQQAVCIADRFKPEQLAGVVVV